MVAWPRAFVSAAASQTAMSANDSCWIVRFMAIVFVGGVVVVAVVVVCWLLAALGRNRSLRRKLAKHVCEPVRRSGDDGDISSSPGWAAKRNRYHQGIIAHGGGA